MSIMKKMAVISALACVLVLSMGTTSVHAGVPQTMNYEGRLSNSSGPVNGTALMTFSLYSTSSGTTSLWTETQNTTVTNGVFNAVLGTINAIPSSVFANDQLWLGIKVGTDPEMTPRQQLASVGYARVSETVQDGAITAAKIGESCAVGEFLVKTQNGWSCGSLAPLPNAIGSCVGNACKLACFANYGDCNSVTSDGCETNLSSSIANCGACGIACSSNHMATVSCLNRICNGTCNAGYADCDNNKQANGCEVSINTDRNNCGGCGVVCVSGQACSNGVCL